ncbi:hypothetical protein tb265_05320 [Gemmatimonadetes bacterium T265]|nr:hypothetical protein tb265_05320 [Gemmatimonadetes bacterium T265]
MQLELIPLVLGGLVVLAGLALVADGWVSDGERRTVERRRRARAERSRGGEIAVGAGLVLIGASLVGGDVWRWATVAVFAGAALTVLGVGLNGRYLRERLTFRGASRRGRTADDRRHLGDPVAPDPDGPRRTNDRRWAERRGR